MIKLSQIKSFAFQLFPKVVKDKLIAYNDNRIMEYWQECFKTKVSKEQVDDLFSQLALEGDVMVHSSLPDIGNIKLRDVTDNLKKYVIDTGHTVLCPALPIKGSTLDYLRSINEFNVTTAPNAMGTISCYYGRQQGAKRSMSPTHSVVAFGCRASYYTEEHHLANTPFTERSPYFKLATNKGKILMFGTTLKNFTFIHVLEDIIGEDCYPVKVYDPHIYKIRLIDESGTINYGFFQAHSHRNSLKIDGAELMGLIAKLPSTKHYHIGCGEVMLLDAREVLLSQLNLLKRGITLMGHRRVSDKCKQRADYWIDYFEQL